MKFQSYSDEALLQETLNLVEQERLTTIQLIECLEEVESRMLYAEMGFSSLWSFCTEYLKLSEGSAQRRIKAMRLVRKSPEAKEAIADGKLSLSNAAKLQTFFAQEKKVGKPKTAKEEKETIEQMHGLSQTQCVKKLFEMSPQFEKSQKEILQPISADQNVLRIILDSEVVEELKELKARLSHQLPNASYTDLIEFLIEDKLKQVRKKVGLSPERRNEKFQDKPQEKLEKQDLDSQSKTISSSRPINSSSDHNAANNSPDDSTIAAAVNITRPRKAIPAATRRALAERSGGKCEYLSPNGARCNSSYFLEIDHIQSFAQGGSDNLENLRHYCRTHNSLHARDTFGSEYMKHVVQND